MLKPGDPSPCCGNREKPHLGGQLARRNPDIPSTDWNPVTETGTLYCNRCHQAFEVRPDSPAVELDR
jgi:uncharacterized protein YbaR (Trm112 family)